MDILANIKNIGEQRLYLMPDSREEQGKKFHLVLSQEDIDSPKATLILAEREGKFVFDIEGNNQLAFYEEQEKADFQERT